mgnify:CR=1 FL=1
MRKLEEHKRRYERLRTEREMKQRRKHVQKIREEHEKAANSNRGGGAKGDFLQSEFMDLFTDPEIQKSMEVSQLFRINRPTNDQKFPCIDTFYVCLKISGDRFNVVLSDEHTRILLINEGEHCDAFSP